MSPQLVDIAIIRAHYDTLIICQSIYPDPGELTFDPETAAMMDKYLESRERDGGELALDEEMTKELRRMRALRLTVQLLIDEDFNKPLTLSVSLPLLVDDTTNGLAKLSVQSPAYLSRLDCDKIEQELASVAEDADTNGFTATDNASYIMDAAQRLILLGSELCQKAADTLEEQSRKKEVVEDEGELQRVWFWFPSLSTREKRKDLVTYASRWGLTGFVLAGTFPIFARSRALLTTSLELHRQARTAMPGRIRETCRRIHGRYQIRILGRHPIIPEKRYAPLLHSALFVPQLSRLSTSDRTVSPSNTNTRIHRHARNHAPHHAARPAWKPRGYEPGQELDGEAWSGRCVGLCRRQWGCWRWKQFLRCSARRLAFSSLRTVSSRESSFGVTVNGENAHLLECTCQCFNQSPEYALAVLTGVHPAHTDFGGRMPFPASECRSPSVWAEIHPWKLKREELQHSFTSRQPGNNGIHLSKRFAARPVTVNAEASFKRRGQRNGLTNLLR